MTHADPFDNCFWFEMEEIHCPCQGEGWANINEEWEECPAHYEGQLHPQSRDLLLDTPVALAEAERVSVLSWKIKQARREMAEAQEKLRQAQLKVNSLELALINGTPTIKMDAVKIQECYPTVQMKAVRI